MDQKTILIVEDDAFLRSALTDKLTHAGFKLHVAQNGEECLEEVFKIRPDLILLDLLMPGVDGFTVMKRLREDSWGKTVKVILLTNIMDAQILAEGDPYLADGYLIKSDTKIGDVVTKIREQLDISKLVDNALNTEFSLPEYRCVCGKLLFKGMLLFSTIEIKCKRCGEVRHIDTTDQKLLG